MTTYAKIKILIGLMSLSSLLALPIEISHGFVWLAAHVFELLEFLLDEIIQHLFDTDRYTTQLIVFYLMLGLILFALYGLMSWLKAYYYRIRIELPRLWSIQKYEAVRYWQNLSRRQKFKMISAMTLGSACFTFLALN